MVAIGATGCTSGVGTEPQAAPPPPEVIELPNPIPAYPEDGLHRFIVTPVPTGLEAEMAEGSTGATSEGGRRLWSVHPDRLDEVADGAVLVFENGRPGYYDVSGRFVAVDGPPTEETDTPSGSESVVTGEWDHAALNALAAREDVVSIEAIGDGSYAVVATDADAVAVDTLDVIDDLPLATADDDPYYRYQWALENTGDNLTRVRRSYQTVVDADIDGREAATVATGSGVVVAVIDTGVDFSHPDLVGKSWINPGDDCKNGIDDDKNGYVDDCRGWDFAGNDNIPFAVGHHAHGTHVAGIIAATSGNGLGVAGVAPDVRIMDLSVSPSGTIRTSAVARAIRYAVDNGADVVNLSLGSAPGVPEAAVIPMIEAVRHAEAAGVLLVVSAGNAGVDLDSAPVYPASIKASNLLTVGASSPADTRARFSNHGQAVDVFAPGELILSTMPGGRFAFMSGTSQSAPLVTGTAALVTQQRPATAPSAVIEHLVATADVVPAFAGYTPSSARLNAARAVGADVAQPEGGSSTLGELVSISGLASASTEAVEALITVDTPDGHFAGDVQWEASLVSVQDDGIYAVVEHEVALSAGDTTTNDRGALVLGSGSSIETKLATTLPSGTYGLVVEAVAVEDPAVRFGNAYVATFTVDPSSGTTDPADGQNTTDTTAPAGGPEPGANGGPTTGRPATTTPSTGDDGATAPSDGSTTVTTTPRSSTPTTSGSGSVTTRRSSSGGGSPATTSPGSTATTSRPTSGGNPGGGTTATTRSTGNAPTTVTTSGPGQTTITPGRPSGGGGTATTAGPGTGGGPANPTTPAPSIPSGPIDEHNGKWTVTDVSPRSGPVAGGTFVSVAGTFPNPAHVWFGDLPGTTFAQTDTWIVVRTPATDAAAVVDMTVRTNADGVVLTVEEAFVYLAAGDGSGRPPSGNPGGTGGRTYPGTPDPGGDSGGTPPAPRDPGADEPRSGDEPGSENGPGAGDEPDGTDDGGNGEGSDPDDRGRQARAAAGADSFEAENGLRLRRLDGLGSLAALAPCQNDPCPLHQLAGA